MLGNDTPLRMALLLFGVKDVLQMMLCSYSWARYCFYFKQMYSLIWSHAIIICQNKQVGENKLIGSGYEKQLPQTVNKMFLLNSLQLQGKGRIQAVVLSFCICSE